MKFEVEYTVTPNEWVGGVIGRSEFIQKEIVPQLRAKIGEQVADSAVVALEGDTVRVTFDTEAKVKALQSELARCASHGGVLLNRVKEFESLGFLKLLQLAWNRLWK